VGETELVGSVAVSSTTNAVPTGERSSALTRSVAPGRTCSARSASTIEDDRATPSTSKSTIFQSPSIFSSTAGPLDSYERSWAPWTALQP
jgi:hypothetical protein